MLDATLERVLFIPPPQDVGEGVSTTGWWYNVCCVRACVRACVRVHSFLCLCLCSYLVGVRNKKKGTLTLHKADIYSVKPTLEGNYTVFYKSHDIHMTLLVQSDPLVEDSMGEKEEPSFMQKVAMVTEAFGGEKRRRVVAAAQRNKLDAETLESTLTSAVELAQENTRREGVV